MGSRELLSEPIAVSDVFVSGLGEIEELVGGNFRFTFYAVQGTERIIVARLIAPGDIIPDAAAMALNAVSGRSMATVFRKLIRGVH